MADTRAETDGGAVAISPAPDIPRVAIIGMAGRFPMGGGLAGFWSGLAEGRESLTRFADDPASGFVAAHGIVPDGDLFDADFFGCAPSEAFLLDPQQRMFLECAWEALEHAGYDPYSYDGAIGVYAGCGDTGHLEQLREHKARFPEVSELQFRLASSVDFLTSRIAYKLGLTGPAVTVQTACSTSLVAVHVAAQALLAGECDMALAGGITLHVPYPHDEPGEDGIVAPDGHCRAFDADASGTIASDGAGIVVLKRLDEALADGDHICAVIMGSAVTNDGSAKVGFTAPGVDGVAAAVHAAHVVADIDPATIDYVEAHGTGTPVGDPIEVRALTKAFAMGTPDTGFALLGTVKSNIGHTDVAAGVVGLLKVVLALQHELIPATLHFRAPNPALDLPSSPFQVNAEARLWPRNGHPRRAGINSMGLGGTNAHVVVQEAPPASGEGSEPAWSHQILPLSARSPAALATAAADLAGHLRNTPDLPLADVSWTLQKGRRPFAHRGFVVATDRADAVRALTREDPGRLMTAPYPAPTEPRPVVFLFPGQGGQHTGMAEELYRGQRAFRADIDACAGLAAPRLGLDLRKVLFPDRRDEVIAAAARRRLATISFSQPAVFAVEYALARLWQAWGVQPAAVTGHSLGAYAAAAIAGVLSLPDAMTLVLERSQLLSEMPAGAMLAVPLSAGDLEPQLGPDLSLAAVNGPAQCVVAGSVGAINAFQGRMAAGGLDGRLLHIGVAAHSHMVEPSLAAFEKMVASVELRPPVIPWISDRTGRPVSPGEATDPAYWSAHLRQTVNFSAVLAAVLKQGDIALLEVGPGRTLGSLARQHPACTASQPVVASMPHPSDDVAGPGVLLAAAGRLWQAGVPIDWGAVHAGEQRRRVPLPTYPFEHQRFRVDQAADPGAQDTAIVAADAASAAVAVWPTQTQAAVAAAYRAILGADLVDGERNFFDLGGDSMLAARVAAILRRELGVQVGVRSVFQAPTVAGLAAMIDERRAALS
jgi:acyl transferase domain-containing protein